MDSTKNIFPSVDERWKICESYLQDKGATEQSKSSFNAFIDREFIHCIYSHFHIETKIGLDLKRNFKVRCTNVKINPPIMLNNDIDIQTPENIPANASICRLLRSSLVSPVYLNLVFDYNGKHEECANLLLCYVPIMAGSNITKKHHKKYNNCDDGYFVLGGNEKCLVHQEKKIERAVLVQNNKCHYFIPTNDVTWWLEETDSTINIRSKLGECDIAIILSTFDVEADQVFPPKLRESFLNWKERSPQEKLHKFKSVFPRQNAITIKHLFESSDKLWEKHLLYMCKSLGEKIDTFDRDHLGYKRVEAVSELLLCVARKSIKRVVTSFQKKILNYIEKNPNKNILRGISRALDSRIVTEAFFYSLSTGNFPSGNGVTGFRTGVCQTRSNYNFNSILSQSRRIRTGDEKRSIIAQRESRGDQMGYLCGFDTSEGKSCGINKHFATMTTISVDFSSEIIYKIITDKVYLHRDVDLNKNFLIFLNGCLIAQADTEQDIVKLKRELRQFKRMGVIDRGTSICYNFNMLHVRSDAGRLLRPLFIVKNLVAHMKTSRFRPDFQSLLQGGIIEYVDSFEEESLQVCFEVNDETVLTCSHAEIHPCLSLSMNTNYANPYCNHNQGPRLTYQCAMQKQSQSQVVENYKDLMYSRSHYLLYGQKPLASTALGSMDGMPQGSGLNCIVAIAPWDGWNQEDSLVISQSFIDRGGFRTLDYKTTMYSGSELIGKDIINKPYKRNNTNFFKNIDDDGLPTPGRRLDKKDIIIAKQILPDEAEDIEGQDTSVKARDKKGIVDRVIIGCGRRRRKGQGENSHKINITTYEMRIPEVGDKFASRHAQKGVCSFIVPEEDLPFVGHSGMKPDIIMSPHALPTRMTIGQLLESIGGKLAAVTGKIEDATAFTSRSVNEIGEEMKKYGFSKYGSETLIDGKTGELMTNSQIFMGCVYYQRLRHMVKDKIHARCPGGPRSCLTRQPPAGKLSNGGHRLGEMESVAVVGSGAAMTHRTLWRQSDPSVWMRCKSCGLYNNKDAETCLHCKEQNLEEIEIPYCFKLLQQELLQCGILTK